MKITLWMVSLLVAFLAGWGTGRRSSNDTSEAASTSQVSLPTKKHASRNRTSAGWGQRLRDQSLEGSPEIWDQVPPGERGASLRAWMESCGLGGPNGNDLSAIRAAFDRWAAEDFDGAWSWATGLQDASMRELSMTSLAASLASSDPDKAFDCLVQHGEFSRDMDDRRLSLLIVGQGRKAAAEGPEALRQLLARIPAVTSAVSRTSGDTLDLPDGADFGAYLDVLREDRETSRKPVFLVGVMEKWAKQDQAAAIGYLLDRGESVSIHSEWYDVMGVVKDAGGQAAADAWVIDTLREVPQEHLGAFFKNANYLHSSERILDLDPALFATGEREELAAGLLEGMAVGEIDYRGLLEKVPARDWLPALENVRGMTGTGPLENYLRAGGVSDDEVARIIAVVKQER